MTPEQRGRFDYLVRAAKELLEEISNTEPLGYTERKYFVDQILEGCCHECGIDNPRCQCWNDE